ncbi:transglutaminase superfamily protein [Kitasatospora sp. SolWspMP-SS2h]|uniref:transglutaminase-like domain-containing protein n=1 Tax=Kitasatospora sp. SolWspMP-SS2h TaxID=1305729 RepID=UPI000DBA6BC4|nr:transglutaminase family protein [Kitasatospora sp. SolWspMP-SS2h]RAJ38608.1 transglutaminase superfamily protein [Kitasatospora sp. SolWspMP-SS2h]
MDLSVSPHGPLRAERPDPAAYLVADRVVDHDHPAIVRLAAELRRADPVRTAEAAFGYVRDRIDHSADVGHWSAAYRASDVLTAGNAICHGKSHLLAALLRANGIPAGLCYQKLEVLHGLNGVLLPGSPWWVRLDGRGNRNGADGHFATTPAEERLAWPSDPALGEHHYTTVHATPPPALLAGLRRGVPGSVGYGHLPLELPDGG